MLWQLGANDYLFIEAIVAPRLSTNQTIKCFPFVKVLATRRAHGWPSVRADVTRCTTHSVVVISLFCLFASYQKSRTPEKLICGSLSWLEGEVILVQVVRHGQMMPDA